MRTSFRPVKVGTRFLLCRIKMGNSTTGIPDSTEKHLHRFFGNVLRNYDGVREITEQGVEMISALFVSGLFFKASFHPFCYDTNSYNHKKKGDHPCCRISDLLFDNKSIGIPFGIFDPVYMYSDIV